MKVLLLFSLVVVYATSSPFHLHKYHESKIILGTDAKRNQFPHMVAVLDSGSRFRCGAGIISPTWIVSAAHCFPFEEDLLAIAGLLDRDENHPDNQKVAIIKIIRHPKYKIPYNDIAVLQLASPLRLNHAVQPIKLPASGSIATGNVWLSGWGRISGSSQVLSTRLQCLEMPLITNEKCNEIFERTNAYPYEIIESMVCALPSKPKQSGCHGDSGSPLVQNGVLVGIVQGGNWNCGAEHFEPLPNAYTRVSFFIDFIKQYVTDLP